MKLRSVQLGLVLLTAQSVRGQCGTVLDGASISVMAVATDSIVVMEGTDYYVLLGIPTWGPLAAGVRAAWAAGGWRAALRLVTKEAVEEGATEAVERVTGIPMVASPMDVLQAARKGGKFIGELSKLGGHERKRAAEYLEAGSSLERIDRGPGGTADFLIDGKVVEFKSLQGDALMDIRTPGGTASDATSIYDRFAGTKEGKSFLGGGGQVRVASSEGLSTFGGGQ